MAKSSAKVEQPPKVSVVSKSSPLTAEKNVSSNEQVSEKEEEQGTAGWYKAMFYNLPADERANYVDQAREQFGDRVAKPPTPFDIFAEEIKGEPTRAEDASERNKVGRGASIHP